MNAPLSAAGPEIGGRESAKPLIRVCPICAHLRGDVMHNQKFAAPSELGAPDSYDVVACCNCGFVFADFLVDQVEIDRAYETHSKYAVNLIDAEPDEVGLQSLQGPPPEPPFDLERMRDAASYLAGLVPNRNARVLDAGCATGALLGFLRDKGFHGVVGLDPSADAVAIAKSVHRVAAVTGSFLFPPAGLGVFDVVVLSHTLEHLPLVTEAIDRLRDLLVPGGVAYVEVPNAARYWEHLVSPFHDFNTEHINHFSLASLRLAMRRGGFSEVDAGEKLVECGPGIPYPAVYGVWRNDAAPASEDAVVPDPVLRAGIDRYVESSAELMAHMSDALSHETRADEGVAVWGAGQLTMKLLRDSVLARRRIVAIVDGSPQRQGLHIDGVPIVGPEALHAWPDVPVVVGSIHSEDSIVRMMREQYQLPNRVVLLYRAPPAAARAALA